MQGENYFASVDIGTESIGWCVTDTAYNVLKRGGRAMWGVRLFDEAQTAAERRVFRTGRRRNDRQTERLKLLQTLFAEQIAAVDAGFFQRMIDSKFYADDKAVEQPNTLFFDAAYTDKDYHKAYPTIYHLRLELMQSDKPHDVRLVYLALHHIIKHRGHFLFEGMELDAVREFSPAWNELCAALDDELDMRFECQQLSKLEQTMRTKSGRSAKKKALCALVSIAESDGDNEKAYKAVLGLLVGCKESLSHIFYSIEENDGEKSELKLSFADDDFEEKSELLEKALGSSFVLLEKIRAVYNWAVLADALQGAGCISQAKVAVYEAHRRDLALLKKVLKEKSPESAKDMFSVMGKANYSAYIGMCKAGGKKIPYQKNNQSVCKREEFYKYVKKALEGIEGDDANLIRDKIDSESFMPKQVTKDNGVIPYQLHLEELRAILRKAEKYLPFLTVSDEYGSVSRKIESLLTFRIPYYVGPLNGAHAKEGDKGFFWAVKRSNEKVLPWRFAELVDTEASAERFIRRMTNKCTYLPTEDVLPKSSLLYQRYMVLNELNNLKLHGSPVSVELKQRIYNDLFKTNKKITGKRLFQYLCQQGELSADEKEAISGFDGDFKSSLSTLLEFDRIFEGALPSEEPLEEAVKAIVLFGQDKKMLGLRMKKLFPAATEKQLTALCNMRCSGWGRLSRELLTDVYVPWDTATGEAINLIGAMWQTNDNLNELLFGELGFKDAIEQRNQSISGAVGLSYQTVDDLYVSPSVKRQIWQTLTVVKELEHILKGRPSKIFVEMARGEEEKKRTKSRKTQLSELYSALKNETRDWMGELEATDEARFRSDRLFLYYTQMGRCMYTGEPIDLNDLYNENVYDIDHIYPQSRIMDDSLDNRVLVKREINAKKGETYPLFSEIRQKRSDYWYMLFSKGFITKRKFERLTRTTEFSQQELTDFIGRQLVETRQSSKAVAEILKEAFPETEIVYVKAGNVSAFRQKYDFIKVRELNDYHHAKDAYLNIVVGNVYHEKFTSDARRYFVKYSNEQYSMKTETLFGHDLVRRGENVWTAGKDGSMKTVAATMRKNNIMVTRLSTQKKGGFYDQMPLKHAAGLIPLKPSDPRLRDTERYGGYNRDAAAYFLYVEHTEKGKRIRSLEYVPVRLAAKLEGNEAAIHDYCINELRLQEPRILLWKVKINSLLVIDGFPMHLSGKNDAQSLAAKGAVQLCLTTEQEKILKSVLKLCKRVEENRRASIQTTAAHDGVDEANTELLYDAFLDKLKNTIYGTKLGAQIRTLERKKEAFVALPIDRRCVVLGQILHLFQCNSVAADLSEIGGASGAGRMVFSRKLSAADSAKLVNLSPTGFYKQEIDLLDPEL